MGARGLGLLGALLLVAVASAARADDEEAVKRGAYLFAAADCAGCHTDAKNNGKPLAGGRALATPFGTFYGPNITPDPQSGIGDWTNAQIKRAITQGIREDGTRMTRTMPFDWYKGIAPADLDAIVAFLRTLKPAGTL